MKLDDSPMFLIARVSRAYHNHASQVFEEFGLHRSQPRVLFELSQEDGKSQKQLGENIGVTSASISNMVKRMERAGFVIRRRDAEDERISRVYLTQAGREIISQVKATSKRLHEIALAGFTDTETGALCEYMQRIFENLR
jgi:DNA-binding MarR family transcriptional regulator